MPIITTATDLEAAPVTGERAFAAKDTIVFSDDFARRDLGPRWQSGIPVFTVTGAALKGSQASDDHGAAIGATLALPDGNAILELKFRFDGANSINAIFDDKSFRGRMNHVAAVTRSRRIRARQCTMKNRPCPSS